MANRTRNNGINIRVSNAEKKKIERNAKKCRLTVSEYLRKLAMEIEPKELPSEEIEKSFQRIGAVVASIEEDKIHDSDPYSIAFSEKITKQLLQISVDTLLLMRHIEPSAEETINGNN